MFQHNLNFLLPAILLATVDVLEYLTLSTTTICYILVLKKAVNNNKQAKNVPIFGPIISFG